MSEREQAKQIIDQLPEYKISGLLMFLQGMKFDDEMEARRAGGGRGEPGRYLQEVLIN